MCGPYELLNSVYATNGYFKLWDNDDCLLMSEGVGDGCSPKLVDEVLQGCLRRSLFDQGVYQMFSVLTSPGIQRRFLRIVGNSRPDIRIFKEYWLLDTGNKKDVPASVLGKLTFESIPRKENPVKSKMCIRDRRWTPPQFLMCRSSGCMSINGSISTRCIF